MSISALKGCTNMPTIKHVHTYRYMYSHNKTDQRFICLLLTNMCTSTCVYINSSHLGYKCLILCRYFICFRDAVRVIREPAHRLNFCGLCG